MIALEHGDRGGEKNVISAIVGSPTAGGWPDHAAQCRQGP
jgi:hypothetical protein